MKAKFINEIAGTKDIARMESIRDKSKEDPEKELMYARNMAKSITNPGKAQARGEAAEEIFGAGDISDIFYNRAKELTGGYEIESTPSKLPGEKPDYSQYEKPASETRGFAKTSSSKFKAFNIGIHRKEDPQEVREPVIHGGGYGRELSIASLGKVNLQTGKSIYFNIYDTWDNTTAEIWEVLKNGSIKIIFTSGDKPLAEINDIAYFKNDQTRRFLFKAKMLDYALLKDVPALIPLYGKSLSGYTYK